MSFVNRHKAVIVSAVASLCALMMMGAHAAIAATPSVSSASTGSFYAQPFEKQLTVSSLSALGRKLFFDAGLSASGRLACASCHDPAHAYGPPNALVVQLGGADMKLPGVRAVPSLRYLQAVQPFTEHFHEDDGDDGVDQGPAGGHDWDGRADSTHEQAKVPLLSPFEMANADAAAVVAKVRRAAYADEFRNAFGAHLFDDDARAFNAVLWALEVFQQEPAEFYPYSSKYDAVLRGKAKLTEQEARGLQWFNDPRKGNCASCHISTIRQGAFPAFSDFGFLALGVPRNPAIPANRDPNYFDLGLCGPYRTDFLDRSEYCGRFRTPSLRNVATRRVFFHNGMFTSLEQVLQFYVTRDTQAAKWYPRGRDGQPERYNDLPAAVRGNVEVGAPYDRKAGQAPALSDAEIRDVIAFLGTLTDGYQP